MNLFQRAVGWVAENTGVVERITDPMDPRLWGAALQRSMAGVDVSPENALQLGVVQACMERLSGTVSSLPFMVFERTGPNAEDRRPAPDHPLMDLLHDGLGEQTGQEFFDELTRHLSWWRNAYAIIRPDEDGFPIGDLEQVHPSRVVDVYRGTNGLRFYKIRRLPPDTQVDIFSQDEIWHIRRAPLTADGLRGRPVWETARETLGRALAVEQFGALFFANGGAGGGVISHPGSFKDKEEQSNFLDAWRAGGGGTNRHKDRLLLKGATYARDTIQNDEAQFLETKKEMKYEVAALWNMPGHMVGLLDRATNNNIENQSTGYVMHTIAPPIHAIEQSARRDLLIGDDKKRFFLAFNVAGLLRGDFKTRWTGYGLGRQWGWLSINDVRRLENMEEIGPEGDTFLVPMNMQPAANVDADVGDEADPQDPEDAQEAD